jgi:LysM repeat protein
MKPQRISIAIAMVGLALMSSTIVMAETLSARSDQSSKNLLANPGFEGDYHIQCSFPGGRPWMTLPCDGSLPTVPWQTVQVAEGWQGWWQIPSSDRQAPDYYQYPNYCGRSAPDGCVAWHNPEYRDTRNAPQDPPRIRSGENSQKYFTFWSVHEAGVYQTVTGVRPGSLLRFSIYMEVWSASKAGEGEPNPHFSFGQSSMHLRVGIDPTGGNDPWSKDIVWSTEHEAYDQFTRFEVEAVARSSKVTVFTHSRPEFPMEHNDVYVDDAELTLIGGGASVPIVVNPPPVVVAVGAQPTAEPGRSGKITHIVRSGDTLFAIALQYGVPVDQIMQLNGLSAESQLELGRELVISLPPINTAARPLTAIGGSGSGQGSICVRTFNDVDRDGLRSDSDQALTVAGLQIDVTDSNGSPIVDRTLDGSADQACFDHLPATVYRVAAQTPSGYSISGSRSWAVALTSDATVDIALGLQIDPASGVIPPELLIGASALIIIAALGIFMWRRKQSQTVKYF